MASTDHVTVERRGPSLWVTFHRPAVRNALTWEMYEMLRGACRDANRDPAIRAVVITGGTLAFAAGTDISLLSTLTDDEAYLAYERRADEIAASIEDVDVPTIAAIGGACTGGGASIAAACDLRIVTDTVRFGVPIARTVGNCVSRAAYARLATLLGPSRAARVFLAAELLGAVELRDAGFVVDVVTPDRLEERATELAAAVSMLAPLTIKATKTALRAVRTQAVPDVDERPWIVECYGSDDFREGIDAFLSKRKPHFTGH